MNLKMIKSWCSNGCNFSNIGPLGTNADGEVIATWLGVRKKDKRYCGPHPCIQHLRGTLLNYRTQFCTLTRIDIWWLSCFAHIESALHLFHYHSNWPPYFWEVFASFPLKTLQGLVSRYLFLLLINGQMFNLHSHLEIPFFEWNF